MGGVGDELQSQHAVDHKLLERRDGLGSSGQDMWHALCLTTSQTLPGCPPERHPQSQASCWDASKLKRIALLMLLDVRDSTVANAEMSVLLDSPS